MMAKDYGIGPWEVEERCTLDWFRNWSALKQAEAQEAKRQEGKHGRRNR